MTATPISKLRLESELGEIKQSVDNMQIIISKMQADVADLKNMVNNGNDYLLNMGNVMDKNYEQSVKTNILLQEILRKLGGEVWKEL